MGCGASSTGASAAAQKHFDEDPENWTTLHKGARLTYYSAMELESEWDPGKLLGEGTFGRVDVVTKRTDPFRGGDFARKTYGLSRYVDDEGEVWPAISLSDLEREINIMQNVGSQEDHVMQIFGVLESPGKVHLILERCDEDLLSYLASGAGAQLAEAELASYAKQLLTAVAHCHERNVMHRKIALEDLLLRRGVAGHHTGDELCLGDFGHATAFIPGKTLRRPKSSPIYASPEEIATGEYTEAIDVWAAGIALLVLVGGLGDVEARTYHALHSEGVRGALALRAHERPEGLVVLLEALLAREPKERVTAAGALKAHDDWLSGKACAAAGTCGATLVASTSDASSHQRRMSDFTERARAQLARVDLQRTVNRGLRRAPTEEVELLASKVKDQTLARQSRDGDDACAHKRRRSVVFRKCVQKVIVSNRTKAEARFVDPVLERDDVLTVAQLREALKETKLLENDSDLADLDAALARCANDETVVHLEISPLVKDHRNFFEPPVNTRQGSKHVKFAYAVDYI